MIDISELLDTMVEYFVDKQHIFFAASYLIPYNFNSCLLLVSEQN